MTSNPMKKTSPTKRPLWWASLSPRTGSQSSLPCQGFCSFIYFFFSIPVVSVLLFSYFYEQGNMLQSLSLRKKTKTNKQNKTKSLFSSCPSGYIPTSLLPFWRNNFSKQFPMHDVSSSFPVNQIFITPLKVFLSMFTFLSLSNLTSSVSPL